jgi:hypothetical protein
MTQIETGEAQTQGSIVGYRAIFPDATLDQLIKIQSDAMVAYRREFLGGTALGASFSVADEVVKSIGRNDA